MSRRQVTLHCAALLFDLDGVLVDSRVSVNRQWRRWAELRGLDPAAVLPVIHGRRAVDIIHELAPELDAEREVKETLLPWETDDLAGNVAIPGAGTLLHKLPAARWAVVTSGMLAVAKARLASVGLPAPRVFITAADVALGKPDPQGYLAAAARLGFAPEECVVVEDAPPGVAAGHAAGMRVIALTTTHGADDLWDADLILRDLRGVRVADADAVGLTLNVAPR